MGGVIMRFLRKSLAICVLLFLYLLGGIAADKLYLRHNAVVLSVSAPKDLSGYERIIRKLKKTVKGNIPALVNTVEEIEENERKLQYEMETALNTIGDYSLNVELESEYLNCVELENGSLPSGLYSRVNIVIDDIETDPLNYVVYYDGTDYVRDTVFTQTLNQSGIFKIRFRLLDWMGSIEHLA